MSQYSCRREKREECGNVISDAHYQLFGRILVDRCEEIEVDRKRLKPGHISRMGGNPIA